MSLPFFLPLTAAALLVAASAAAQVTFPMTARELFHRLDPTDNASPARIVPLAANGLSPGYTIRLQVLGEYDNGPGGDIFNGMMAVFSSSNTLLAGNLLARVPDAIDAGVDYVTIPTCPSNLPTDIPEDFTLSTTGVDVRIPDGATHLFISVRDCLVKDNSDPDQDFAVRISIVSTDADAAPSAGLALLPPRPNPASTQVNLAFSLPRAAEVRLSLHDLSGRRVRSLVEGTQTAGIHEAVWDGRDALGTPVAAGLYFVRLRADGTLQTRKVVVAR